MTGSHQITEVLQKDKQMAQGQLVGGTSPAGIVARKDMYHGCFAAQGNSCQKTRHHLPSMESRELEG